MIKFMDEEKGFQFIRIVSDCCWCHRFAPYNFATFPAISEGTSSDNKASVILVCSTLLLSLLLSQILRISVDETWLYLGSPSM